MPFPKYVKYTLGVQTVLNFAPFADQVRDDLSAIQQRIRAHPIDGTILKSIIDLVRASSCPRMIFRSSTNAEDIPNFNAAGLYDSVSIKTDSIDEKKIGEAVKEVWASIWNVRAFLERHIFGLRTADVAMCVLVQPHYSDDSILANGVAITANPNDCIKYGVFISAFPGGSHRATDTGSVITPEQTMIHMSRVVGQFEPEMIAAARGNGIDPKRSVLPVGQIKLLGQKSALLHKAILHQDISESTKEAVDWIKAIDIEWLLLGPDDGHSEPRILIVQARPCPVQVTKS